MSNWGDIMKSEVPPLLIGSASLDVGTATVLGLIFVIGVSIFIGIRKDVAMLGFVAGALTIALTM